MPPTSSVSNDANTFMPLLFAAHPEIVPNYRRMAAMDDQGRSYSALEHKFRNWRQAGKQILLEKGDSVDPATPGAKSPATPSRPAPALRGGGDGEKKKPRKKVEKRGEDDESGRKSDGNPGKNGDSEDENDEVESTKKPKV